jgi:hypothetical protein
MSRSDKLSKLVAVYDEFQLALNLLEDGKATMLRENWPRVRSAYANPIKGVPRSAMAAGMEQGLRETPMLFRSMEPATRAIVGRALAKAIENHYPEFASKDTARLEKIVSRGYIRGENEYYLVRHRIDVLEDDELRLPELDQCYVLIEQFDAKPKGRSR